jgi:hypothetical protein
VTAKRLPSVCPKAFTGSLWPVRSRRMEPGWALRPLKSLIASLELWGLTQRCAWVGDPLFDSLRSAFPPLMPIPRHTPIESNDA